MTQNAADVRLFIRAATAAASVGAGGDGKFAYTMKQSLSAVSERRVERKNERATEAKAIDRDRRCNHAMQPARLNNVALRLNCSIEVGAIRPWNNFFCVHLLKPSGASKLDVVHTKGVNKYR